MTSVYAPPALPADCAALSPQFQKFVADLTQVRDSPKPAGWRESQGWVMANVHVFMINMLVRTYAFAEQAVEKNDLVNYLGFADIAFGQIGNHHHFEEELVFPYHQEISKLDIWSQNVVQHHLFAPKLDLCWQYVRTCRHNINPLLPPVVKEIIAEAEAVKLDGTELDPAKGPAEQGGFDPVALRRCMDSYMAILAEHLWDEIGTLKPENMQAFGDKEAKEFDAKVDQHLKAYDPSWFLCSTMAMMPMPNLKQLIPLPMPVRRVLVPFVFARKHWGIWPYCSHPQASALLGTDAYSNLTFGGSA